jgi:hypothetical protein
MASPAPAPLHYSGGAGANSGGAEVPPKMAESKTNLLANTLSPELALTYNTCTAHTLCPRISSNVFMIHMGSYFLLTFPTLRISG